MLWYGWATKFQTMGILIGSWDKSQIMSLQYDELKYDAIVVQLFDNCETQGFDIHIIF